METNKIICVTIDTKIKYVKRVGHSNIELVDNKKEATIFYTKNTYEKYLSLVKITTRYKYKIVGLEVKNEN